MRTTLLVLFLSLPLRAEAGGCPAPGRPASVTVAPLLPAVQETHSSSYHELSNKMKQALKPGQDTMGLSSSRLDTKFHFDFRVLRLSGQSCYYLASIEAQFGYDYRLVQIAREVPKASCLYDEIRKHEYKHVAVDEAAVRDNVSYVAAHLRGFAKSLGAVEAANDQEAQRDIDRVLRAAMRPILGHVTALRTAAQDQVDTPTEYARVEQACQAPANSLEASPSPTSTAPSAQPDSNHK